MADHFQTRKLSIFISSTGDLESYRKAAFDIIKKLHLKGLRFEYWPSSPSNPIDECLQWISEADAFILLLGGRYGSISDKGISVTHLEYKTALLRKLPIFAFQIDSGQIEQRQKSFIEEIRKNHFQCQILDSESKLKRAIENSIINEFIKCFKAYHKPPEELAHQINVDLIQNEATVYLPHDSFAALKLITELYSQRKDDQILQYEDQIFSIFPNDHQIHYYFYCSVINLAMNGKYKNNSLILRAIDFFQNRLNIDNEFQHVILYNLGNAFAAIGKSEEAIDYFKKAIDLKRENASAWKNMGGEFHKLNNYKQAELHYKEALKIDPTLIEAKYSLSVLYISRMEESENALPILESIDITQVPEDYKSSILYWIGLAYKNLQKYDSAINYAEKSLLSSGSEKYSWFLLAELYSIIRRFDSKYLLKAKEFFSQFIQKFPNIPSAYAELGYICWFLRESDNTNKNTDLALLSFEKAMQMNYLDDGLIWDRIGHLYEALKDHTKAEEAYKNSVLLNKAEFGYCLGHLFLSQDRYNDALKYLSDAANFYQQDALSWFNLGVCYVGLNQISNAISAYENSIELDPTYPEPYFNLGGLYWNSSEIEGAKSIWDIAIKTFPNHKLATVAKFFLESL
ncbi:tetratricopeptide repeat protein [Leptospira sp. 201903074]|uniref:tetratricopeptide repeat protein n=1 Tax=Leptospira abararensis TaxID=2810036 RepID=UPI0019628DB0|nr:tetratricopeptide repeat protein [Leptospira abararensis]MBM9548096.1 tetratricopeptide repeat protein [Leptospira abararensis]